jgi:hypothetical protein
LLRAFLRFVANDRPPISAVTLFLRPLIVAALVPSVGTADRCLAQTPLHTKL